MFPASTGHEVLPVRPQRLAVPSVALEAMQVLVVRFVRPGTSAAPEHLPQRGPSVRVVESDATDQHRARVLCELADASPHAFLLPLEVDDELSVDALERLCAVMVRAPRTDIAYADHVDVSSGGFAPRCKPAWSPHLAWTMEYTAAPTLYRASLLAQLPSGQRGGGLHALLVRAGARARRIAHVPDVLCWRRRADVPIEETSELTRAIEEQVRDVRVQVEPADGHAGRLVVRLRPLQRPRVSVIVPFRDKPELLETCVRGVLDQTDYDDVELLLVDNASTEPATAALLELLRGDRRVQVLRDESSPFNYSAVNNRAAARATGSLLLLLNNDIEVVDPQWLDDLVGYVLQPDVGSVGALLLYPDGRVQHAGVAVGIGGYASHPLARLAPATPTPWGDSDMQRDLLATTGACVMVRREAWDAVGGLDESFQLCGSDVALGLAMHQRALRNVVLPHVRLVHHESVSRGSEIPRGDFVRSREAYDPWVGGADPFYHPSLTFDGDDCSLAARRSFEDIPPVRWSTPSPSGAR